MDFKIEKFNQYGLTEGVKHSTCPLCSKDRKKHDEKCASLDWKTGLGTCHHCGEVFQLHTYTKKEPRKTYEKPIFNKTNLSDKLVLWFKSRGISAKTLMQNKITEGTEWMPSVKRAINTVQFNYFMNDELVNIKYRDGKKGFKLFKGGILVFYNIDNIRGSSEVVITEGEMDALSYWEAGVQTVVSTPNGSTLKGVNLEYLDNTIDFFENKEKIYLALDNDPAGKNVTKEFIRRLGAEKCFLVDFKDVKDANEYLLKYGRVSLANTILEAVQAPIEGVSSLSDWEEEYDDYLLHGMKKGYVIGKHNFDEIFSTYTGQIISVTGVPGHGKSDWVDEMVLGYVRNYGWKVAVASPENKPNPIHAGKIEAKIAGKWVNRKDYVRSSWHKKAKEFIDNHYKFIDIEKYSLENVLDRTKQLVKRFGVKCLVIDPFNKIKLIESRNKSITDYTADYLFMLDEFARQSDILIILIAHPRKPSTDEKNYRPSFYDIKGGGEFFDMSSHGLAVYRYYELDDVIEVKVLKAKFRHLGKNESSAFFKWDKRSGRFSQYTGTAIDDLGTLIENDENYISEKQEELW